MKRSYGNAPRRLRLPGRLKAIPEIITIIPSIENIFGLDAAEVENNLKMFASCMGDYKLKRKSVSSSSRRDT